MKKTEHIARVLFVDDEPDINEAFTYILEKRGFDVRSAFSVREALNILESWSPDILLSDYNMPEQNGGDLLMSLRQNYPELSLKLKFIFFTGSLATVMSDVRCRGVQVIEKPIRFRVFEHTLVSIAYDRNHYNGAGLFMVGAE